MNSEKFLYSFFIILSLCLSIEIVYMSIHSIIQEGIYLLLAAFVVNIFITMKSIKDKSKIGPLLLASSLAADFHLIAAIFVYEMVSENYMMLIDNWLITLLVIGAAIANIIFMFIYIINVLMLKRSGC